MISAVSNCERGFPAHSSCAQYQRRWTAKDYVCVDVHQGSWTPVCQYRVQESGRGYEQEVFSFALPESHPICFVVLGVVNLAASVPNYLLRLSSVGSLDPVTVALLLGFVNVDNDSLIILPY